MIFIVAYGNFQYQLSGFSRIYYENIFSKKSKIGHGGATRNCIPRSTTVSVTDFSKTFLVVYKWPDLTDVQGILRGTVRRRVPSALVFKKSEIIGIQNTMPAQVIIENVFIMTFPRIIPEN
jgi:hypothetical protein